MPAKTPTDKFNRRRKMLLKQFDFDEVVKMMRAVDFGWTKFMQYPTHENIKTRAIATANELIDHAVEKCLKDNEAVETGTGGFYVTAWPNGDLQLDFTPKREICSDFDGDYEDDDKDE